MNLTETDIEFGFWYFKTRSPVYLNYDDPKINSEKNLGIGFYDEHNTSRELKKWNEKLESLENVEYLWTYHKLNQDTFDVLTRMKNLKGLNIKWSSIKSLEGIEKLENIEHLNLGLSTSITDLKPIPRLKSLITLESENLKKVKNWDLIGELPNLEGLGISGGMYQTLKLNSIIFLKDLTKLKYLFLINTSINDSSLSPIENLKNLQCIRLSNRWKDEQLKNLRLNLPKLKYGNVALDETTKRLHKVFRQKKN